VIVNGLEDPLHGESVLSGGLGRKRRSVAARQQTRT